MNHTPCHSALFLANLLEGDQAEADYQGLLAGGCPKRFVPHVRVVSGSLLGRRL